MRLTGAQYDGEAQIESDRRLRDMDERWLAQHHPQYRTEPVEQPSPPEPESESVRLLRQLASPGPISSASGTAFARLTEQKAIMASLEKP